MHCRKDSLHTLCEACFQAAIPLCKDSLDTLCKVFFPLAWHSASMFEHVYKADMLQTVFEAFQQKRLSSCLQPTPLCFVQCGSSVTAPFTKSCRHKVQPPLYL